MKILTESLRTYLKILSLAYMKGAWNTESIYLNFVDNYIYFFNSFFTGRIKINTVFENEVNNFFVDIPIFITLISEYSDLVINSNFDFCHGDEKFKPLTFKAKGQEIETFKEIFRYKEENWQEYKIPANLIENFNIASNFSGEKEYNGVLLKGNCIFATDTSRFFQAQVKFDSLTDLKLSTNAISFIKEGLKISKDVSLFYSPDGAVCININQDDVEIVCPKILVLNIPDIQSEDFRKKWDHDSYIEIEKQQILNVLQFFEGFVKNEYNEKLLFSFTKNQMQVQSVGKIPGNRILTLSHCSEYLNDKEILLSRYMLIQAINTIEDDFLRIRIDPLAPAIAISGVSNTDRIVLLVKLLEKKGEKKV